MKAIILKFQIFFLGFECVLVQKFLIQTLFSVLFLSEGRLSYPLFGDMIILCVGKIIKKDKLNIDHYILDITSALLYIATFQRLT